MLFRSGQGRTETSTGKTGGSQEELIRPNIPLQLLHLGTNSYLGKPERRFDNWESGMIKDMPSSHFFIPEKKTEGGIADGDRVRIKSQETIAEDYNFLYVTTVGNVLYDIFRENTNSQLWIVKKVKGDQVEIHNKDVIYLENAMYPGSRLGVKDDKLICNKNNDVWELRLPQGQFK